MIDLLLNLKYHNAYYRTLIMAHLDFQLSAQLNFFK